MIHYVHIYLAHARDVSPSDISSHSIFALSWSSVSDVHPAMNPSRHRRSFAQNKTENLFPIAFLVPTEVHCKSDCMG